MRPRNYAEASVVLGQRVEVDGDLHPSQVVVVYVVAVPGSVAHTEMALRPVEPEVRPQQRLRYLVNTLVVDQVSHSRVTLKPRLDGLVLIGLEFVVAAKLAHDAQRCRAKLVHLVLGQQSTKNEKPERFVVVDLALGEHINPLTERYRRWLWCSARAYEVRVRSMALIRSFSGGWV